MGSRLAFIGVLALIASSYQARAIRDLVRVLGTAEGAVRAPFRDVSMTGRIAGVREEAAAAGLQPGDRITSLGGRAYEGRKTIAEALRGARPGDALAIGVDRSDGAESIQSTIRLRAQSPGGRPAVEVSLVVAVGILLPAVSLLLGFAVALRRPFDPRALLLLLMMMSFAQLPGLDIADEATWGPGWRVVGTFYDQIMASTWSVWMLLFGIAFPERLPLDRRRPWLKWLVIGPLAVLALTRAVSSVAQVEGLTWAADIVASKGTVTTLQIALAMVAVLGFFACLGFKGGTDATPDGRRRLRLLRAGAAASLTPSFLLALASLVTGRPMESVASPWVFVTALLALPVFPLTLAYVIVVHRALDVRVVVRQGLQYALARRGVTVLQILVIGAAILGVTTLVGEEAASRPRRIAYLVAAVAFILLIRRAADRAAERARSWLDARFFREAYDAEHVLTGLSEDVRRIVDTQTLLTTVGQRLAATLHVRRLAALLRDDGFYVPAYRLSEGPEVRLSAASPVVLRLRDSRRPLTVNLADPRSWINREADPADRETLAALEADLLLPLVVKDSLLGMLSLGAKRSEEPYSPSDVRLLEVVAAQTAIALENSQLTAEIARETAFRARLSREIEIAREVQEGLFPQNYPPVEGIEYVGYCRPALGVGGDYYDFVRVGDGRLGVAVGDVSGKGIPAALLMASLRASVHAQAISSPPDLATLMQRLNALIYEASPGNRYATFFYGQYDPATRHLAYVNAGHNPPMVFRPRAGGVDVLRVEGGGPVIGLLPAAEYAQCGIDLLPGDLLLGYTDGVSEAMNTADEEWGEEHMAQAVRACLGLPPRAVVQQVMAAADAFASGARQHDDMTLVVVRVV